MRRWEYNMSVDREDVLRIISDVKVNERWAEKGMDDISIACRSSCGRRSRPPSRKAWSCLSVCCRSAISTKSVKLSYQYIFSAGLLIWSKFWIRYCMYAMMASYDSQSFDVVELLSLFASKTMSGSSKAISLKTRHKDTYTQWYCWCWWQRE